MRCESNRIVNSTVIDTYGISFTRKVWILVETVYEYVETLQNFIQRDQNERRKDRVVNSTVINI